MTSHPPPPSRAGQTRAVENTEQRGMQRKGRAVWRVEWQAHLRHVGSKVRPCFVSHLVHVLARWFGSQIKPAGDSTCC